MSPTDSIFLSSLIWFAPLGYLLIFAGMIVEGEGVLFTIAFLTRRAVFNFPIAFIVVFVGVIFGDFVWYRLGQKSWRFTSPFRWWAERFVKPFDGQIMEKPFKTLLISKFTYGFHHAVLMRAGAQKLPLPSLLPADALASLFWIMIIGGLGYLSGATFFLVKQYLKFAELALLLGLIILFSLQHLTNMYLRKKL